MNPDVQPEPAAPQYVLVFNRRAQPITFYVAQPVGKLDLADRDSVLDLRGSLRAVAFWPGLTLVSTADAEAMQLSAPSNPHLDRALRILKNPLDLGEGDAVQAARACGDLRVLRWMGGLPWHSYAVSKAIAERIAEIESGKPRAPERRTADDDNGQIDFLGEIS